MPPGDYRATCRIPLCRYCLGSVNSSWNVWPKSIVITSERASAASIASGHPPDHHRNRGAARRIRVSSPAEPPQAAAPSAKKTASAFAPHWLACPSRTANFWQCAHIEALSMAQIAKALGINEGAAKVRHILRAPSRPNFPRGTAMILNGATSTSQEAKSDVILAELVDRFIDRFHAGEWVDARAFAAEHPAHAAQLLEILPAAATMATLPVPLLRSEPMSAHFRLDSDAIGGYRILREIGRGGMGVVYEAVQVATGRKVALKVLPISSAMDPRQIERFRIEGQAAAALDHPHIVPVFEIGCENGIHFYAMRFVEGSSLAALVHTARSGESPAFMPSREAAHLALQAAEALAHAHGMGIVHRDVKPANLLLEPAGHLWVADFGLAHFVNGGDLTQTGDVIGTLRYLSPEQAKGQRKLDARTDIYSLGATLYELVTLHPAFDGHDRHELLRQIASQEPIPPTRLDPTIPRDLETILASAMAKEVEDRYGSATELADDLRRFLDGRPILARRPDAPTRAVAGLAAIRSRWPARRQCSLSSCSARQSG